MEYYKNYNLKSIKYFCEIDLVWKLEQWEDVLDYEGIYQISDLGRIKSLSRIKMNSGKNPFVRKEMMMKQSFDTKKYLHIILCKNTIRKTIKVHQLLAIAFLGHKRCGSLLVVNHKNFIKSDNRKVNLEIVTTRENSNLKHIKSNSQYVGVCFHKASSKWRARIFINKERICLGYFINEIDAHNAYQEKLKTLL